MRSSVPESSPLTSAYNSRLLILVACWRVAADQHLEEALECSCGLLRVALRLLTV